MRTSNSKAWSLVNDKETFEGSNTFAEWESGMYVVYSYGRHFPMYVWDSWDKKWLGNKDKYSQSTTRHQSQCRPSGEINTWFNTVELKNLISMGGLLEYTISKAQT